jgi:hypothetical protein
MGGRGLEQSALSPSKTPISQTQGAKSGALKSDFSQNDPDLAAIVRAWAGLPADVKRQIKRLIERSRNLKP